MRRRDCGSLASTAAIVVAALALFAALGGPAYAAKKVKQISGSSIKAGTVTSKQLADGAVTLAKVATSAQKALKAAGGATGPKGPAGPNGQPGLRGATGRAGGMDVYDAKDRRIGTYAGTISALLLVVNDQGAVFVYDHDPSSSYALPLVAGLLFFKAAGCEGQPYLVPSSAYPPNWATTLTSPGLAGDPAYMAQPGAAPETFTALSTQSSSGCADGSASATNAVPAIEAGVVPTVKKPLSLRPRT